MIAKKLQFSNMPELTIAIPKGRMQAEVLKLFSYAGLSVRQETFAHRQLAVIDESGRYRIVFVKPADVLVYVEHGSADCGVVGRDILLESRTNTKPVLDLGINRCRVVVAELLESSHRQRGRTV